MSRAMACGGDDRAKQGKSVFMQYDNGDRHVPSCTPAQWHRSGVCSSCGAARTSEANDEDLLLDAPHGDLPPSRSSSRESMACIFYSIPQISTCGYEVLLGPRRRAKGGPCGLPHIVHRQRSVQSFSDWTSVIGHSSGYEGTADQLGRKALLGRLRHDEAPLAIFLPRWRP